jgi:hypothetical protein
VKGTTYEGGQRTLYLVMKVPRQCPFVLMVMVMHMIGIVMIMEGLCWSKIWSKNRRVTSAKFLYVAIRRAACESCNAAWNLGTNRVFSLEPRKNTQQLNRVDRWHDLANAN